MHIIYQKPELYHSTGIKAVCSTGWKQTVEGQLSKNYQTENIAYWYNENKIKKDILIGTYTHIALNENKVVGVIGGAMTSEDKGEIFVFYVDESYRYQGIGRNLLKLLTNEQRKLGAIEQWVSVQKGNQRGIPFYESNDFKRQVLKETITDTGEVQFSWRYNREIS